jgi:hypothetical protein
MTGPARSLGDFWAEAFSKPSKLWRPAPDWKPHEWTPLPAALDRLLGRTGLDIACFDLHAHLVTGRIESALQHLYETRASLLLLQPEFWQPLQFRRGQGGFIRPEGTVEGKPLGGGAWAFFMRTADLDKHYPVAASAASRSDVVQVQQPDPEQRQRRGPKPRGDWKFLVGTELIRLAYVDPTALKDRTKLREHMRGFLEGKIQWAPEDNKQIAKVIKDYLAGIE